MFIPDEIDRGGKLWVKQAQEKRFSEETQDLVKKWKDRATWNLLLRSSVAKSIIEIFS